MYEKHVLDKTLFCLSFSHFFRSKNGPFGPKFAFFGHIFWLKFAESVRKESFSQNIILALFWSFLDPKNSFFRAKNAFLVIYFDFFAEISEQFPRFYIYHHRRHCSNDNSVPSFITSIRTLSFGLHYESAIAISQKKSMYNIFYFILYILCKIFKLSWFKF